jgi:wyosine [tRNA(Phe)-imidazoG37] synthetase (radical SAM superfamily)
MSGDTVIAFGPVPSRRLGMSLGINMIPPKTCTYSCVYCQIGRTNELRVERKEFYSTRDIEKSVQKRIEEAQKRGISIDYLTFVPDGEPTLEIALGEQIESMKRFGLRIAVITNSSLLWNAKVRKDLSQADWVSVKIDSVQEDTWRRISRAHEALELERILSGTEKFSEEFGGTLTTETMLVREVNDLPEAIMQTVSFITGLKPEKSYVSIPLRPPSEEWVKPSSEYKLGLAYHLFSARGIPTELLSGYEGNQFQSTGDTVNDLLSITSVHPMRDDSVEEYLRDAGSEWDVVERLLKEKKLVEVFYEGKKFYLRSLRNGFMTGSDTN